MEKEFDTVEGTIDTVETKKNKKSFLSFRN